MPLSASPFSLKDQLAFYGAYHTNSVNVFIHIICVPLIWMSMLVLVLASGATLEGLAAKLPAELAQPVYEFCAKVTSTFPAALFPHMNFSALLAGLYLAYYYVLDVGSALLITPLWIAYYLASYYVAFHVEGGVKASAIAFFVSWIMQFYGHGVHEGRAPALLDNLLGAVVLAPLFVFLEVLFHFGYRPELQKWLKNETSRLILKFRQEQAAKKAKAT